MHSIHSRSRGAGHLDIPVASHRHGGSSRECGPGDQCSFPHGGSGVAETAAPSGSAPAQADLVRLMPVFERLVDETVAQVMACPAKPDPTFDGFEELLAPIRSATTLEGALLERGVEAVCSCRDDLVVVPLENPLPVLPEARAFLRRNDWAKASALRLGSEVHTREFYRPDLLVVDATAHRALLLDIKRSVGSHKPKVLAELRTRIMAAALVTRDWLERECDAPPVERVEIAIVDGAGDPADHARAIFALSDLDLLLDINGAAVAIEALRHLYAARLREILLPRCRRIAGVAVGSGDQHKNQEPASPDALFRWERPKGRPGGFRDHDDGAAGPDSDAAAVGEAGASALRHDARVSVGIALLGGRA